MKHIKLFEQFITEGVININDIVIENPKYGGFGFSGKKGIVKTVKDKGDLIVYIVDFDGTKQEYHDNEIIKSK